MRAQLADSVQKVLKRVGVDAASIEAHTGVVGSTLKAALARHQG